MGVWGGGRGRRKKQDHVSYHHPERVYGVGCCTESLSSRTPNSVPASHTPPSFNSQFQVQQKPTSKAAREVALRGPRGTAERIPGTGRDHDARASLGEWGEGGRRCAPARPSQRCLPRQATAARGGRQKRLLRARSRDGGAGGGRRLTLPPMRGGSCHGSAREP